MTHDCLVFSTLWYLNKKFFHLYFLKNHLKYYYLSFSIKGSNTGLMKTTDQGPHWQLVLSGYHTNMEILELSKILLLAGVHAAWKNPGSCCLTYTIPSSTPEPAEGVLRTTSAFMGRWESTPQIIWKIHTPRKGDFFSRVIYRSKKGKAPERRLLTPCASPDATEVLKRRSHSRVFCARSRREGLWDRVCQRRSK